MTEFETLAGRMLEVWVREMRQTSTTHPLDGGMVLSETQRHRSIARMFRRDTDGNLIQVAYTTRIHAKESKRVIRPIIKISPTAEVIESAMLKIRTVNDNYFDALALSYALPNMHAIASEMNIGLDRARRLRKSAFDMVCVLLVDGD